MPMQVAILGHESTLAALAHQLYRIEGSDSADLERRAEAALLAANPRLAKAEGFTVGTPVVVPAVSGLVLTDKVKSAGIDEQGLTNETAMRLQALSSGIDDSFRQAAEVRQEAMAHLNDSKFVASAKEALPESTKLLDAARDRLMQEGKEAETTSKNFQGAVSTALERLQFLEELLRSDGQV
ncbi:hypothetical protein [Microbulbifer epialgicus]|uniref:Uncharacterized protein n=1 Tax=Microbulbifer epialgicus TaxID=393907 RepID=A0ABV4NZG7_9GAMM